MPEKLVGKLPLGFSTIEIIIALALMVTIISGALSANFMAYYWRLTAVTAGEALAKAKGFLQPC
jgi:Tfp pilus assembly protein PilV